MPCQCSFWIQLICGLLVVRLLVQILQVSFTLSLQMLEHERLSLLKESQMSAPLGNLGLPSSDSMSSIYLQTFPIKEQLLRLNQSEIQSLKEIYQWSPRPYEPNPRPAIHDMVQIDDGWRVISDPQWILNFAIAAFPKCGTSTLMHYFSQNTEIHMHKDERCDLGYNHQVRLIQDLYGDFPPGDFVRGIKCPRDVENRLALLNYQRYFPKTDFIIGIRHPVKWFESFYNHRIQNNYTMMDIPKLIGTCSKNGHGVCTNRAAFHVSLSMLGKTQQTRAERNLMPRFGQRRLQSFNLTGRVFLYEIDQLNDRNETRARQFRKDLQRFLYLKNDLPPMVWFKPGRTQDSTVHAAKINICDHQYKSLRKALMDHARNGSQWIRNYFMTSSSVVVSSPQHFANLLENWKNDPCHDGGNYKTTTQTLNCTKFGCFIDTTAVLSLL